MKYLKKFLKFLLKTLLKLVGAVVGAVLVFVIAIVMYNKLMMKREAARIDPPMGKLVEVDGSKMCVYQGGEGKKTLCFLSGWNTPSPILDYKALYSQMYDDYNIVVIERFGYGYSDDVEGERDLGTILKQDRAALSKAGVKGPLILCPTDIAGYEAVLWAQDYPEEVQAIIGLDMYVPGYYNKAETEDRIENSEKEARHKKFGAFRILHVEDEYEALDSDGLTDEEKNQYRTFIYTKRWNSTAIEELNNIETSAKMTAQKDAPEIPTLLFVSSNSEEDYIAAAKNYADGLKKSKVIEEDCSRPVYNYKYKEICEDMKSYIAGNVK